MRPDKSISFFIPCFNNSHSLERTINSFASQNVDPVSSLLVDDASTDTSPEIAESLGFSVVRFEKNKGRGAVRAEGINRCQSELMLSCDATNVLRPNFLEKAYPWFSDPRVAAVFGRLCDSDPKGLAGRWRARHLYSQDAVKHVEIGNGFCSWAFVCRPAIIRAVGNFREDYTHSEDHELGVRLRAAGYKVVFEPSCLASPSTQNTIKQCLERHWRWHIARGGKMSVASLFKWISIAVRSMAVEDIRNRDPLSAMVSLILPFHHFAKSRSAPSPK